MRGPQYRLLRSVAGDREMWFAVSDQESGVTTRSTGVASKRSSRICCHDPSHSMTPGTGTGSVRTLAHDMKRLAGKLDDPALALALGRDKNFRVASESYLVDRANTVLSDLDDLAVLVLSPSSRRRFATAPWRTLTVNWPRSAPRHQAGHQGTEGSHRERQFRQGHGGVPRYGRRLDDPGQPGAQYRNWVAHGRRDDPKNKVNPGSRPRTGSASTSID